jgi:hypothetical protein
MPWPIGILKQIEAMPKSSAKTGVCVAQSNMTSIRYRIHPVGTIGAFRQDFGVK